MTLDNKVLFIDEFQNLNGHELDSILTRVGRNTRIILSDDVFQSDFRNDREKASSVAVMSILNKCESFNMIEFDQYEDIVRSDFVREYIAARRNWQYNLSGANPEPPILLNTMNNFTYRYNLPDLTTRTIDSKRHYIIDCEGSDPIAYPSITSILGWYSAQGIQQWRKRVGEKSVEPRQYG